jgi:putative MATE family efflux protein
MMVIQVFGMTLGVGSGSLVARLLGKKDQASARTASSSAFFFALIFGIILAVTGRLFSSPLMMLLGSTETILPNAREYADIIVLGAPFMAASFVLNINLRSEGSAFLAMLGLVSGALLNIILDPIFIFVFRMGVSGAALATVISQVVSFCILLSHYMMRRSTLAISWDYVKFEKNLLWEFFRSGLPTFLRMSLSTLAVIVLNSNAGNYGDAAIAGMTVVTRIMMFIFSALIGFGHGFQPVAAFNYSAGKHDRVYKAFLFAVRVGTVVLLLACIVAGIFAEQVVRFFRDDPEVVAIGIVALRFQCFTMPMNAFTTISNMLFQYIGKPWKAATLAASRQGLIFIPSLLLLTHFFGLMGLQAGQSVSDMLSLVLAIPLAYTTMRQLKGVELPVAG